MEKVYAHGERKIRNAEATTKTTTTRLCMFVPLANINDKGPLLAERILGKN